MSKMILLPLCDEMTLKKLWYSWLTLEPNISSHNHSELENLAQIFFKYFFLGEPPFQEKSISVRWCDILNKALLLFSRSGRLEFADGGWQSHPWAFDCFFHLLARVFLVKWKVSSSNFRFLWARDVKGLSCKMYLPHVVI